MTSSFQRTSRYNASENNLIKNFDITDLWFMEKYYKSFPLKEYALERGHIQCPHRWKTSDFHILHVFNPSKKTFDLFNLAEWKGMLSSSWLPQHETSCDSEIQTKKDFKSKFIKQLGSSPITSLNNKGKKKELECTQLYYLTIWTQEKRRRTLDLQTLGLQGRCIVYLFELSYIYTPFVIASHH